MQNLTPEEIDVIKAEAKEYAMKNGWGKSMDSLEAEWCQRDFVSIVTSERQRAKVLFDALTDLIILKNHKDIAGKDPFYESEQPKAWKKAKEAIAAYKQKL